MIDTYVQAVKYVKLGWSVIPLWPNTKIVMLPKAEKNPEYNPIVFHKRYPTDEELKKWFLNTNNNIGICTGELSDLTALDADEIKNMPNVTSQIQVITKRGKHLYFKNDNERNSQGTIDDDIDTRGYNGYVVAPPSIVGGFRYRFVNPNIVVGLLKPFPKGLLNDSSQSDSANRVKSANPPGWISKSIEDVENGGPRTPNFVKIIGSMRGKHYTASDIYSLLAPLAKNRDYDLDKLKELIDDQEKRYPNGQTESYEIHTAEGKAENLEKFLQGEEKVDWIVPGLVAKKSIGFCAGLPESLKTWVMIDLAIECARGGKWLGYKVNKSRVLFVDQERFVGETRRRFKKMLIGKNIKMDEDLNHNLVIQVGSSIRLNLDVSFEAFRKKLNEIKPDLLIVDSFATFSTVAENDRQEVQKVIERIKQIRQEFGCTVLMIDHEGKGVLSNDNAGKTPDAYSMIGSVAKPAAAEVVLTVRKETDSSVTVYNTKNSLAPAIAPITVQLVDTENEGVRIEQL
jgi:KaiC/GvpD/RAD55 family RecA-like ATPase